MGRVRESESEGKRKAASEKIKKKMDNGTR